MTSCKIVLENYQGTCYSGKTISGHLLCTFPSTESIQGAKVKLRGKESNDWYEGEIYYDNHVKKTKYRKVHYTGCNEFLAVDLTLIGEGTMEAGRYEYPFTFTLPRNLPTNFQGSHGYIKYSIEGTVHRTFASNCEDEMYFNVHSPIDFNEIRSELQMEPTIYQDETTICCLCCESGPITLDVHLQKEAFVLGESANIKIDVANFSNENIDGLNVKMTMVIESKATSPKTKCKYDYELVTLDRDTGVGAHGQRIYHFNLDVPCSTALYNFIGCTLFKQYFVLKVEAVLAGCHSNMEVKTNVVLGHIPIADGPQTQPSQQISHSTSTFPEGLLQTPPPAYVPDSQPPPYSDLDEVPPYPTGPPKFHAIAAIPGQFSLPPSSGDPQKPIVPSLGMLPVPVHGASHPPGPGSSTTAANAPPAECNPSAPTEAEMAEDKNFIIIDDEGPQSQPPPTYGAAVSAPFASTPDVYPPGVYPGVYPPGPLSRNGPSAPSPK